MNLRDLALRIRALIAPRRADRELHQELVTTTTSYGVLPTFRN